MGEKKSVLSNPRGWPLFWQLAVTSFFFHLIVLPWSSVLWCVHLLDNTFFSNIKTIPAPFPSIIGSLSFYLRYIFQKMKISLLVYHVPQLHCASHSASERQVVRVLHPPLFPPAPGALMSFLPPLKNLLNALWSRELFVFRRSRIFMHVGSTGKVTEFILLLTYFVMFFEVIFSYL